MAQQGHVGFRHSLPNQEDSRPLGGGCGCRGFRVDAQVLRSQLDSLVRILADDHVSKAISAVMDVRLEV